MGLFSKEMMFLDQEFNSADELFAFVNERAMENGLVREGFLQGIQEREKHFPTALPGIHVDIAVPHTDPEYIVEPFISVIRCKKGIPFVQMASDNLIIHPKIFFVLGFKKEGCEKYQVKALTLLIDYFIATENGRHADEFMDLDADACMDVLFELENKLLGEENT